MEILIGILVFGLGLIIGSFLNVMLFRYGTTRSIVIARSACMQCGKVLGVLELVPVASYALQRGRCVGCKKPLSVQYPLVEIAMGIVLAFLYVRYGFSVELLPLLVLLGGIGALLILIFAYDLRHKIIPDEFNFTFIALAGASMFFSSTGGFTVPSLSQVCAGPVLFAVFYALWAISKGRWIGFGDVKFVWGIGWMFGLGLGLSSVVLAFWIGAAVSLAILLVGKLFHHTTLGLKSEVPFAPFLILGMVTTIVFGIDVLGVYKIYGI